MSSGHIIRDEQTVIESGDLYRVREDEHGQYCQWTSAEHYVGTVAGQFAAFFSRNIEFFRPIKPITEGKCVVDIDKKHWLTNPTEIVEFGDLFRWRTDDGEYTVWHAADHLAGWRLDSFASWYPLGVQFARVPTTAEQPQRFEQQPQRGQEQPAPKQPPTPTPDRGSKYHRTITQTLPGDTHGLYIRVDVYDVLQAFGVTCPALQHAAKKILCAGLRGSKSAEQDIQEAANSCRRAIELLEGDL